VSFATITLCIASQQVFVVQQSLFILLLIQCGKFWIHPHIWHPPDVQLHKGTFMIEILQIAGGSLIQTRQLPNVTSANRQLH
jgi:hypothetical protein